MTDQGHRWRPFTIRINDDVVTLTNEPHGEAQFAHRYFSTSEDARQAASLALNACELLLERLSQQYVHTSIKIAGR